MSIDVFTESADGPDSISVDFKTCDIDLLTDLASAGIPGAGDILVERLGSSTST